MRSLIAAFLLGLTCAIAQNEVRLGERTRFLFADETQARQVLTNRDDFVIRLSSFDRAARMKSAEEVDEGQFLEFVGSQALSFQPGEVAGIERSLLALRPGIEKHKLRWPETILLVKTTGREEANAAYTRGAAIILPENELRSRTEGALQALLCHELFHVLSRHDALLKKKLYSLIGFTECNEVPFPDNLVRITNPDAPKNDYWIEVMVKGKRTLAVPILYAEPPRYDVLRGGSFFDYLRFKLLVVEKGGEGADVTFDSKAPILLEPGSVEGFFEQIGQNTDYIIHPEEILAENFRILVMQVKDVKSPEVLARLEKALLDE